MKLSIIVPAHNEEHRIGSMLDAYLPYYSQRYGNDVEVVVVLNACKDGTKGVIESYAARFPCLRSVEEPVPGKGKALIRGFGEARGELVGFVDADGSTPPAAFQDLVENIGAAGAIIASRWRKGSIVSPRQPLDRRIASRIFNLLVRFLFGLRLTDTQCGAKLMKREAIRRILPDIGTTQWAFDVDLLFHLKRAGLRLLDIPTTWHDVRGSKIDVVSVSIEMLAALMRLRLFYSPCRWSVALYNRFVAPIVQPKGMVPDRLVRRSLLLIFSGQTLNVFNMLCQIAMVRMLSAVEYGVMATMLALFNLLTIPMSSMGRTISHFSSRFVSEGRPQAIWGLIRKVFLDLLSGGLLLVAFACLFQDRLQAFFGLIHPWPLILTGAAVLIRLFQPVLDGALHGLQAFKWGSMVQLAWGLSRAVFSVILVAVLGGTASVALSGNLLAVVMGFCLALIGCITVMPAGDGASPCKRLPVYRYFAKSLFTLSAFSVLSFADVVVVKHYFDAEQTGVFAAAAMVARIAIFLPGPIASAMLPQVASFGEVTSESRRTLIKGLIPVCISVLTVGGVCTFLPRPVLSIMVGEFDSEHVWLLRGLVWVFAPVSITGVMVNFEIAQRRFWISAPLMFSAGIYLVGVVFLHKSLEQVVAVVGVATVLGMLLSAACVWISLRRGSGAQGNHVRSRGGGIPS